MNDLLDKERDRQDPAKRKRPHAAGQLSSRTVTGLAVGLIVVAAVQGTWLPSSFQLIVATYLFICLTYSLLLKRMKLIDILTLTILFDLRLAAGAAAIMISLPIKLLLAGSCFFFTVALLKRIMELSASRAMFERLSGRPYARANLQTLRVLAGASIVASLFASAMLLSETRGMGVLWLVLLLQATWLTRCYFAAARGRLNEDLVLFVITDVPSYGIGLAVLTLIATG